MLRTSYTCAARREKEKGKWLRIYILFRNIYYAVVFVSIENYLNCNSENIYVEITLCQLKTLSTAIYINNSFKEFYSSCLLFITNITENMLR